VRSRISVAAMDANSVVNITKVIVAGNHRTELSYYQPELSEVCRPGQTFQQVTNELCKARDNLVSTDYFDDVDLNLTVSPSERGPNDCVLKVNVKEKQILRLKIGGQTGNDEPTGAVLELGLRTPLGFGEELTFSYVQSIAQELTAAISMRNIGPQKLDMKIKGRSFRESYPFTSVDHQLDAVSMVLNSRDHIRRLKLEVLKNAFCLAIFAGLGGYSLASRHNLHNTALSTVFYIVTALGLMFFIPRLAWTTWKFLESNAKPDYQEVEEETYSV
jgi:hypothetical protein